MSAAAKPDLTGVWHGLYSYPAYLEPVYFVATLIGSGAGFSGTTHEAATGRTGAPLTLYAALSGSLAHPTVAFIKTYDGTGGWRHSVKYAGEIDGDATEIEGRWIISAAWSGRFLMLRSAGMSEDAVRKVFETV
jgi:hypothetical protein